MDPCAHATYAAILPVMFHPVSGAPVLRVNAVQRQTMHGHSFHACDAFGGEVRDFDTAAQCAAHWAAILAPGLGFNVSTLAPFLLQNKHMATVLTDNGESVFFVVQVPYKGLFEEGGLVIDTHSCKDILNHGRSYEVTALSPVSHKPRPGFRFIPLNQPVVHCLSMQQVLACPAAAWGSRRPFLHHGTFYTVTPSLKAAVSQLQAVISPSN
jgi:hypothetical protein